MAVLMRGSITKREQAGRGMRVNDPAGIAPRNGQHSAEVVAHWRESVEPQSKSSPAHHRIAYAFPTGTATSRPCAFKTLDSASITRHTPHC
jgi:hypothetical protein